MLKKIIGKNILNDKCALVTYKKTLKSKTLSFDQGNNFQMHM